MDRKQTEKVATLARLELTEQELNSFPESLSSILSWVEQLNSVKTDGVAPLASVSDVTLPLRDDAVTDGNYPDKVTANAPESNHNFYSVPKVVE